MLDKKNNFQKLCQVEGRHNMNMKILTILIILILPSCSELSSEPINTKNETGFLFIQDAFPLNPNNLEQSCLTEGSKGWAFTIKIKEEMWPEFSSLTQKYTGGQLAFTDGNKVYFLSKIQEPFETRQSISFQINDIEKDEAVKIQETLFGAAVFCEP